VLFRPFILSHFSMWLLIPGRSLNSVEWKGETGRILDSWLDEVDAAHDAELFKRLYPWKHRTGRWEGVGAKRWRADLSGRFVGGAARRTALEPLNIDIAVAF
jgi:hypothetical protein